MGGVRCLQTNEDVGVWRLLKESSMPSRIPVVADTDMGSDDWLALLFLLQCRSVSVRAITVNGAGLSHGDQGIRNLLNLTKVMGRDDILVARGSDGPLHAARVKHFETPGMGI